MRVQVYEVRRGGEGRVIGLGNSLEVPVGEAIKGVKEGRYKAALATLGVVPEEWEPEAVEAAAEAEEADEFDIDGSR